MPDEQRMWLRPHQIDFVWSKVAGIAAAPDVDTINITAYVYVVHIVKGLQR